MWNDSAALLNLASVVALAAGLVVAVYGEESRIKLRFFVLCVACAVLAQGIRVEVHDPARAHLAARVNMTAALIVALAASEAIRVMMKLEVSKVVLATAVAASALQVGSVWFTNAYLEAGLRHYPWGTYVAGDPRLALNPLLVSAIGAYCLTLLARQLRTAHPIDKNRARFLFAAFALLATSLLDYLPHFGVDLFGGPVSALALPGFIGMLAYALSRYRLLPFREVAVSAGIWTLGSAAALSTVVISLDLGHRLGVGEDNAHLFAGGGGALALLASGLGVGPLVRRLLNVEHRDLTDALQRFGHEVAVLVDEARIRTHAATMIAQTFADSKVVWIGAEELREATFRDTLEQGVAVDLEVWRRHHPTPAGLPATLELILPLGSRSNDLGALGLLATAEQHTRSSVAALETVAAFTGMALRASQAATELERRHQLDRYLAPQVVDAVLAGRVDTVEAHRRVFVTTVFSDIAGFSDLADRLEPDKLSVILDEYLSEMASIAFRHSGTVDKFIGDAVMVLFGAPVDSSREEQTAHALQMALEWQRALPALNASWIGRGLIRTEDAVRIRIGVHGGEATIGAFGSAERVEYTAIGHAVNIAARLEGKCTVGAVLMSSRTHDYCPSDIRAEYRGPIPVKGIAEPIDSWEISTATCSADDATRA